LLIPSISQLATPRYRLAASDGSIDQPVTDSAAPTAAGVRQRCG
jgi:hypothetical protein